MDFLEPILFGFGVVLTPTNLAFCLLGVTLGMVIGVLPGLGPTATIAILLPVTYAIPSETAIIMLAGIYYGAQYGGTITSVLLSLPGEASTVVTTFDGYQMARTGRAGNALGIAAIGSFIGATLSIIAMTFVAPVVAGFALDFGPPEYTALAVLGILLVSTLGTGAPLKCAIAALLGLLLATVGRDPVVGAQRFTFDVLYLTDGFDFVPIVMGLFGLGEILYQLGARAEAAVATSEVGRAWPTREDFRQSRGAIARGSVVGFFLGILPGGGATLSSLVSYGMEKRRSKTPERFGKGAIEGVAGPESANNAAATSSFIPLLTLGIPANSTIAIIFGALMLQGVSPGPLLITNNPEVFWGVIDSMYIGNLFLLILSVPMVGLFIRIVRVRASILSPITVIVIMLGVYTVNTSFYDMLVVIGFGILGYAMKKYGYEPGPLVLAFVLGGLLETAFRQSLRMFNGDLLGFVERPISGTLFAAVVVFGAVLPFIRYARGARRSRSRSRPKVDVGA